MKEPITAIECVRGGGKGIIHLRHRGEEEALCGGDTVGDRWLHHIDPPDEWELRHRKVGSWCYSCWAAWKWPFGKPLESKRPKGSIGDQFMAKMAERTRAIRRERAAMNELLDELDRIDPVSGPLDFLLPKREL